MLEEVDKDMFKIFMSKANNLYDAHVKELSNFIREQKALGISNTDIFNRLQSDMENGEGIYEGLSGQMSKELNRSLNLTFQGASNDFGDSGKYVWQLDPSAEHCDSCLYQESRGELPINEFPVPGNQETHGTNCNEYCKCTLMKV